MDLEQFPSHFANVDKIVVFGGMARHTGIHVPNEYIHNFTKTCAVSEKLIPFVVLDPHDIGFMDDVWEREKRKHYRQSAPAASTVACGMRNRTDVDLNTAYSDGKAFPDELREALRPFAWKHQYY